MRVCSCQAIAESSRIEPQELDHSNIQFLSENADPNPGAQVVNSGQMLNLIKSKRQLPFGRFPQCDPWNKTAGPADLSLQRSLINKEIAVTP
jgi:hypothetical protein